MVELNQVGVTLEVARTKLGDQMLKLIKAVINTRFHEGK